MYDLELIDVITFSSRFAILNQYYKKGTPKYKKKHVLHLISFLKDHFKPRETERNDVEYHRIIGNLHEWLLKSKHWEHTNKVTLRLPDTIASHKWSNTELDLLSEYITKMIKVHTACFLPHKEMDNVFGIAEWLVSILSQKYTNTNLKQILNMFNETLIV